MENATGSISDRQTEHWRVHYLVASWLRSLMKEICLLVTSRIHTPEATKIDTEWMIAQTRHRAVNILERPRQTILQSATGASLESRQNLPSYPCLQRIIQCETKRDHQQPHNPGSVAEINNPVQLTITIPGELFLVCAVFPELFVQLFTVHGLLDNGVFPVVYVLLQIKTKEVSL